MDAVIDSWLEGKADETVLRIIEARGWRHSDETKWLKFLIQRNRFDEYFVAELAPRVNQSAIARMLANPEGANADKTATESAAAALGRISETGTIDAVIDCWLEGKAGETARLVIEERKWRHTEEAKWLTFLTQRNRFDEYFVAELAPLVNQPAIARMLAHPKAAARASKSATETAATALSQISATAAVDAVIDCWLDGWAGATVRRVIEEQKWRHSGDANWLNLQTKRFEYDEYFATKLAPLVNQPAIARILAHRYHYHSTAEPAAVALGRISETEAMDSVIDCWLEGKASETARRIIEARGWRHSDEAKWLKFLIRRNGFDEKFVAELAPQVNQPAIARMLAHPEGANADKTATESAAAALGRISEAETMDAVIDSWLEGKAGETARQVIEERGWRHSQEARWFLYLAATGRFDEYLAEDYEFQTLRPEFVAAPATLKTRIREAVVKAGEVRMNGLFLAEKRAAELTVADAEALVHTNIRNQNWKALADNLWWLPARQILDAVLAIIAAKWEPDDADQAALLTRLGELAPLLASEAPKGLCSLPLNPAYQKWLTSGETGPLSQKSPTELKAMIEDEVDPPDQIAALGALHKQSQLDAATLAKAGLSEHWMVRWVAVHFGADLPQAMQVNDAGIEWFRRLAILRNDGDAEALWAAKPCEVTRDGLEALREHIARLPDRRAASGLLLVEAICSHYTAHDIEVEEGTRVLVAEDSFELEG
jgi:ethanolamine utilization microcompartment shell protein EutS